MLEKLKVAYRVFTIGQAVADPVKWKAGHVTGQMLAVLLGAFVTLARATGIDISLSDSDLVQLGSALVIIGGLFGAGVTVASTDKIGLPALGDRPGAPELPAVAAPVPPAVPPGRRAANGDALDDSQRRE